VGFSRGHYKKIGRRIMSNLANLVLSVGNAAVFGVSGWWGNIFAAVFCFGIFLWALHLERR